MVILYYYKPYQVPANRAFFLSITKGKSLYG